MAITIEQKDGLKRAVQLEVPYETYQQRFDTRAQEVAKTAKIDGFRPGKVPLKVVKERYQQGIQNEILGDMMWENFRQQMENLEDSPLPGPNFKLLELESGKPIKYEVEFEVLPDLSDVNLLNNEKIELLKADPKDSDVDDMLERLRQQAATYKTVERAIQKEDQVTIDFKGMLGDKPLENGEANDFKLVIGSNSLIAGFEDGLIGMKAGDKTTLELKFPEEYHHAEVAGQPVHFDVMVHLVEEAELPEVDQQFCENYGVKEGGIEKLKEMLMKTIKHQVQTKILTKNKQTVMAKFTELNPIPVPEVFLKQEMERIHQSFMKQFAEQGQNPDMKLPVEIFKEQAMNNIRVGFLLDQVSKDNDIKATDDDVKKQAEEIAESYEKPEEAVAYYMDDDQRREELRNLCLENKLYDFLREQADVTWVEQAVSEIMAAE